MEVIRGKIKMKKMRLLIEIECNTERWENFKNLIQKTMDKENIVYSMSDQSFGKQPRLP